MVIMNIRKLLFLLSGTATLLAQQQDPASMQTQMNAADQLQSSALTTSYKTPFKTYQLYYTAYTTNKTKELLACYTPALKAKTLDGAPATDEYFSQVDAKMASFGSPTFRLLAFLYAGNAQRATINFTVSYTLQQDTRKEQITLVMVDTNDGWKIDDIASTEK